MVLPPLLGAWGGPDPDQFIAEMPHVERPLQHSLWVLGLGRATSKKIGPAASFMQGGLKREEAC